MDFEYTTIFSSTVKPLVSEEKDKYLALASLMEVGELIPEINVEKNVDLLPIAFNACVANRVNKNHDVVDTQTALAMADYFINKPINIEHNRERVVGVILTAGFTEFGSDKQISREELENFNGPFNVALGGVVWKVVNSRLANIIEEASDPTSESYMKVSASWELGFSEYNIVALDPEDKNLEYAEIYSSEEDLGKYKKYLKAFGGSGALENGKKIYRQVINNVLPLGIGLTENPAADVKGVSTNKTTMAEESEKVEFLQKSEEKSSLSCEKDVKLNKESVMEKIESIKDITDENLKELQASVVSDFIEQELQKASEQFVTEKQEIETKLQAAQDEHQQLLEEHSKLKEDFEKINESLEVIKSEVAAKEAEETFNQRMSFFDEEYELNDDTRSLLASEIKDMGEEDFEAYAKKMNLLLPRPEKVEAVETVEASETVEVEEVVAEEATSEEESVEEVIEEAIDNSVEAKSEIPTTSEATEPTLIEKYKNAFSLEEGFEIK
tara:strand:+ start:626 stop:2122 length:1497 start_codon:yes stop_codon:yes gene_type:complete